MIYYIRNEKGDTLVDIDLYIKTEDGKRYIELKSTVCIIPYSKFLLDANENDPTDCVGIMTTFDNLNELRGWLWESYFMGENNDAKEYRNVAKELNSILQDVCKKYNLFVVTD